MNKLVYISGPISAKTKKQQRKNLDRFFVIEDELSLFDLEIANPARWEEKRQHTWEWYMNRDLSWIKENKPDMIFMMNGWRESKGAIRELELCIKLGIAVMFEDESVDNKDLLK